MLHFLINLLQNNYIHPFNMQKHQYFALHGGYFKGKILFSWYHVLLWMIYLVG